LGGARAMRDINIMTSCDNNLAKYILPQLASVHENLNAYHVNFYLVHCRIHDDSLELIRTYVKTLEDSISFYEVVIENPAPFMELARLGGGWAYEAYFSLCCHEYLPENIDRILYIDAGDVIIDDDISEYYFGNFEGKSLIATIARFKDNGAGDMVALDRTDMSDDTQLAAIARGVLNSGSYVINVNQFRADQLSINDFIGVSGILCERFPNKQEVYFGDQGLISVAFLDDIRYFAYPEIKNLWYMPYNFCLWFFDRMDELWYTPKILHYAGIKFKPWQARLSIENLKKYNFQADFNNIYAPFFMKYKQLEFCEKWWSYCKGTPIYESVDTTASAYARALEEHFLPLCEKYNALVNDNFLLQKKSQTKGSIAISHNRKKKKR
jgi:lipopolysaccharide biosynthesis glycosyltransferase